MSKLTREQVETYLKGHGHPQPDADGTLDEFMNGGARQAMYDEAVRNNYALPDVDRWFHLVKVMGVDMKFETALKIDRALYEEDLETMELNLPEERFGLDAYGRGVFKGSFEDVKDQVRAEVIQKEGFRVGQLADLQVPGLTLSDAFKLYAELRGETDGAKTLLLMDPTRMYDLARTEDTLLADYELRDILKDYIILDDRDPLDAFIEKEVAFRLPFVHELDASEEVCRLVAEEVKNHNDVMFDYDRFDNFLLEQYDVIKCVDQDLLKAINENIARLLCEISPDVRFDVYVPDEKKQLDKLLVIKDLMMKAGKLGATMHLDPNAIIDNEHLDSFWYGERKDVEIGSFEYQGYRISIEVRGDVEMSVMAENMEDELISYRKQDGKGTLENPALMAVVPNDDVLHYLEGEGRLNWALNNWVECFVFDQKGNEIQSLNEVLNWNVLDAFGHVDRIIQMIRGHEKLMDISKGPVDDRMFIFDEELMVNDDLESVNGYLWAVDALVDRIPGSDVMENINFYADYQAETGAVSVDAVYWTTVDGKEMQKTVGIELSDEEKAALLVAMEAYSQKKDGMSLLEQVNACRAEYDLGPVPRAPKGALDAQILVAEAEKMEPVQSVGTRVVARE